MRIQTSSNKVMLMLLALVPTLRTTGLESTGQTTGIFFRGKVNINMSDLIMDFLNNDFN